MIQEIEGDSACPLCHSPHTLFFHEDKTRIYRQCSNCQLVFVPTSFHLSPSEEKKIYHFHQNNPDDAGYRTFLMRIVSPMLSAFSEHDFTIQDKGLDFGSGPGPTLSLLFEEHGYCMKNYDLYFAPYPELLQKKYDFVTSTEVWEHLRHPAKIIDDIFKLGQERFILGVMTKRVPAENFTQWHYIKDPTHICFYCDKTFEYIAQKYQCELRLISNDVAILIRNPAC